MEKKEYKPTTEDKEITLSDADYMIYQLLTEIKELLITKTR